MAIKNVRGVAALLAAAVALKEARAQAITVGGSLTAGPQGQGVCNLSGSSTDQFLCSNGAFCTWQTTTSQFECFGGTPVADEETSTPTNEGPPGLWVCEGGSSSSETAESGGTGEACVVHGGHTHGDCSNSCNGVDLGEYDMDLHIAAVFVMLVASLLGVLLPLFSVTLSTKPLFSAAFFAAKHFGTGVIICTAFVHLLYHSFIMFGNACLGELVFEPAAAAISMAGTYVVFGIEFTVMRWLRARADKRAYVTGQQRSGSGTLPPSPSTSSNEGKKLDEFGHMHDHTHAHDNAYNVAQAHADVTILEGGIIFHSIMIGVSLGASGGSQWIPLFIAIVFHQMFEGLALGSRIALLDWKSGQGYKKWVMAGAFGFITPIGVAIGIGVHQSYNPNSGAALLSIGVLDAISAGILIYAGLVEMLFHDFMLGPLARAGLKKVSAAFFFVLAGSLCMAILGKWA
ncbi:hypothetical protein OIO90_005242 [Microbotryomycetes sp. JL221]|nr:hypothetical protein OIO90_005242 [Microbotryomycetes sp. JL221]